MFNELIENITNVKVFTDSISLWVENLSVNTVIIFIMMIFMIVGAVDKMRGNKLGYGEQFDEGLNAMGPLAIAMLGVVAAAPVLALILKPIVVPVYELFGADASMFAGTLLAIDMGGYPLAMQLGTDEAVGNFAGIILGSMMGTTVVFTIPVALTLIRKEDKSYLAAGILAGLITVPVGCLAGGLVMNITSYKMSIVGILVNLIPVILIAGLIVLGLWFVPQKMISGFNKFGTGLTILITFCTAAAVFQYETGIKFPLLNIMVEPDESGVIPLESGIATVGQIAIVLIGAFPMVTWITRTFGRSLARIGTKLGMDDAGAAGLITTMANNIAMFNTMGEMNAKGKLLNVAFAVSASFVFGDHLGFVAGVNQEFILPMVAGKLAAGITALLLANLLAPKLLGKIESNQTEQQ